MNLEELSHGFAEFSPQPTIVIDGLTHCVRYSNPAFSLFQGGEETDIVGRHVHDVLGLKGEKLCIESLKHVYETGQSASFLAEKAPRSENQFWSYYCWAACGISGQAMGVIIQIMDATENVTFRKRSTDLNETLLVTSLHQHELREKAEHLNNELKAVTQAKSQFLAAMSHEIRTPLNAIMGFSELLAMANQTQVDRKEYGARIKRHSILLLRLIDDILDLSKVESGRLDIEKIDVNIFEILADINLSMQHFALEKGISFTISYDGEIPSTLSSDPTRLKQILLNIIGNAVKFTNRGTVAVRVSVDIVAEKLRFKVQDSGEGMTPEQAARLFQPFTQGDSAITRKFGGTGLGLDLSRRLARALGGDVVIVESKLGAGSIFEISVALENPRHNHSPRLSSTKEAALLFKLDGVHVLLADDAPDNRLLVEKYLTLAGATVDCAVDGAEAIAKTLRGNYDIILMDIQMPKVDGYTATSELRALGCLKPILAMTAHAMLAEIHQCRIAGCDGHLAKPFGMRELVEKVHGLVHRSDWEASHRGDFH